MTATTIQAQATGRSALGNSPMRPVSWLRVAAGTLVATLLIIGLMALVGRALPAHPEWAEPSPGAMIELADRSLA